jgi:anti-sigma B factor antagonist
MFSHFRQGAVDIISGDEPLQYESCDRFLGTVEPILRRGQPRLVIDLGRISFVDSAGLETLLEVRDRCAQRGGVCKLAAANALCRDILAATGIGNEFEVADSLIDGAGSFAL